MMQSRSRSVFLFPALLLLLTVLAVTCSSPASASSTPDDLPLVVFAVGNSNASIRGEYMQAAMNGAGSGCGATLLAPGEDSDGYVGTLCRVIFLFVNNVIQGGTDETCDYYCTFEQAVALSPDLAVGVSFQYTSAISELAAANPDIDFAGIDIGFDPPIDNVEGFIWKEDQSGYLAGVAAGEVAIETGRKTLGAVGGIAVPAVKKFINGFVDGVLAVCPDCTVYETFSSSFGSQEEGEAHADQMIDRGVEIAFCAGGFTGTSACKKMAANEIYVIGVDVDEYLSSWGAGAVEGSEYVLTSALKNVDVAAARAIECFLFEFEQCTGRTSFLEAANGGIGLAPCHEACSVFTDLIQVRIRDIFVALADGALSTGIDGISGDRLIGAVNDLSSLPLYDDSP